MKQIQTNDQSKKAELSLTVIVSAVIALVVLIVLIYIFMNSSQRTSSTFASCGINGGSCETGSTCPGTRYQLNGDGLCPSSQICCSRANFLCSDADAKAGKCTQ